jgi:hypothetical protein
LMCLLGLRSVLLAVVKIHGKWQMLLISTNLHVGTARASLIL